MQLVIDTEKQTQQPLAEYISKQALENTELHKQIGIYRAFVVGLCHDLGVSLQTDLMGLRAAVNRGFVANDSRRKLLDIYAELDVSDTGGTLLKRLERCLEAIKKLKSNIGANTEGIPLLRTLAATLDLPVAANDTPAQTVREIINAVRRMKIVSEQRKNTIEVIGKANRAMREQKLTGVAKERHAEVAKERNELRTALEQEKQRSAAVERKLADAILLGDRLAQELRDEKVKAVNTCPPGFKVVAKDTLDYARHQPGDSHFKVVPV